MAMVSMKNVFCGHRVCYMAFKHVTRPRNAFWVQNIGYGPKNNCYEDAIQFPTLSCLNGRQVQDFPTLRHTASTVASKASNTMPKNWQERNTYSNSQCQFVDAVVAVVVVVLKMCLGKSVHVITLEYQAYSLLPKLIVWSDSNRFEGKIPCAVFRSLSYGLTNYELSACCFFNVLHDYIQRHICFCLCRHTRSFVNRVRSSMIHTRCSSGHGRQPIIFAPRRVVCRPS